MFRLVLRLGEQRGVIVRVLVGPRATLGGAADQPTVAAGNAGGALTGFAWAARPRSSCSGQDPSTDTDSVRPKSHLRNDPCKTVLRDAFSARVDAGTGVAQPVARSM